MTIPLLNEVVCHKIFFLMVYLMIWQRKKLWIMNIKRQLKFRTVVYEVSSCMGAPVYKILARILWLIESEVKWTGLIFCNNNLHSPTFCKHIPVTKRMLFRGGEGGECFILTFLFNVKWICLGTYYLMNELLKF